jgi:protein SCO1/2
MRTRLVAALLGAVLLSACGEDPKPQAAGYHGVEPTKPVDRPRFVLTDDKGAPFDFHEQTGGHPTFVYFGYTNCPDECPTAMADVAAALRKASSEVRETVKVVFVTTDPARDTGPVLRRFLDQFDSSFIGLTGSGLDVARAQTAAGVTPGRPEGVNPTEPGRPDTHKHEPGTAPHQHFGPLGYAVSHSALIFAYDAADRLPVAYPGGVTPSDIAADLPLLHTPPD